MIVVNNLIKTDLIKRFSSRDVVVEVARDFRMALAEACLVDGERAAQRRFRLAGRVVACRNAARLLGRIATPGSRT